MVLNKQGMSSTTMKIHMTLMHYARGRDKYTVPLRHG